jgi:hypothetical protein
MQRLHDGHPPYIAYDITALWSGRRRKSSPLLCNSIRLFIRRSGVRVAYDAPQIRCFPAAPDSFCASRKKALEHGAYGLRNYVTSAYDFDAASIAASITASDGAQTRTDRQRTYRVHPALQ